MVLHRSCIRKLLQPCVWQPWRMKTKWSSAEFWRQLRYLGWVLFAFWLNALLGFLLMFFYFRPTSMTSMKRTGRSGVVVSWAPSHRPGPRPKREFLLRKLPRGWTKSLLWYIHCYWIQDQLQFLCLVHMLDNVRDISSISSTIMFAFCRLLLCRSLKLKLFDVLVRCFVECFLWLWIAQLFKYPCFYCLIFANLVQTLV